MYKVIIVDDEDIVRRSIVKKIDWAHIGFETPLQACNGLEAYELAQREKPDLVFADIKMPVMDGLELATKLKETLPKTHVVIFSGHDEFTYAQESITLGVLDYILKPLGSVTLTTKFLEIKEKLDKEFAKRTYIEKMKDQLHKSLPLLKESFLNGLVSSPTSLVYSVARMKSLDIRLGHGPYIVCVIEPIIDPQESDLTDIFLFGMKNIIRESIGNHHPYFTDVNGRIVIIFCLESLKESMDSELLQETLTIIQKAFELHLRLSVTMGIGKSVTALNELTNSYNDALSALDCKYNMGTGKIYDISDLHDIKTEFYYPSSFGARFIAAVKSNNHNDIKESLIDIRKDIASKENLSLPNLKFIFIEMVTGLTKLLAEIKNSSPQLWARNLELYIIIEDYGSTEYVTKALESVAILIANSLSYLSLSSRKNIVLNAIDFIQKNYSNDQLSLKYVASQVAVSGGYLSAIFKSESGKNFNAYLNQLRVEEAKKLLSTTTMTIYDIAYSIGYSNPHYFSVNFKKLTGHSPSDFRHQILSQ